MIQTLLTYVAAANKREGAGEPHMFGSNHNNTEFDELQFLNDEFLTDFEWALGNDFLLPPETYGEMAWPATGNTDLNLPSV